MHLLIQILIVTGYAAAAIYSWRQFHTILTHAILVLVFVGLFIAWQEHAYIISYFHEYLHVKVATDDGDVNEHGHMLHMNHN